MAPRTEADLLPPMRDLLEHAGLRIRSATRADCAHCTGRSTGTVSYNAEFAHCFRCDWATNRVGLGCELGLLGSDPATRARLRAEARRRMRLEAPIREFERWREAKLRDVSDRYYALSKRATLAHRVLMKFPNCESAWDALARFYQKEAQLARADS